MAYERVWLKDDDEFPGMNVGYVRVSAVTDDVADYVEAQKMAIQRFVEDRGGVVVRCSALVRGRRYNWGRLGWASLTANADGR